MISVELRIGISSAKAPPQAAFHEESHQALSGPRPFCERPLSSVACGDTFFQRKKALALHHAALAIQRVFP
jgi:hypothetical protein